MAELDSEETLLTQNSGVEYTVSQFNTNTKSVSQSMQVVSPEEEVAYNAMKRALQQYQQNMN